jgi:hypothetical protein
MTDDEKVHEEATKKLLFEFIDSLDDMNRLSGRGGKITAKIQMDELIYSITIDVNTLEEEGDYSLN